MRYLKIKNWHKFQHYKDRSPPWIKLHFEILISEDWVKWDDDSKLVAVILAILGSRKGGIIPEDPEYVQRVGQLKIMPDFEPLLRSGFLIPLSKEEAAAIGSIDFASDLQADASIAQAGNIGNDLNWQKCIEICEKINHERKDSWTFQFLRKCAKCDYRHFDVMLEYLKIVHKQYLTSDKRSFGNYGTIGA